MTIALKASMPFSIVEDFAAQGIKRSGAFLREQGTGSTEPRANGVNQFVADLFDSGWIECNVFIF
ncbi:MAG TPA: hypothetical protein VGG99_23595 [Acetobacteraceae bacterium]